VVAHQAQNQATQGRDLSTLAPELERKTAGAVEHWATTGGVGQPALPQAEELDERTADAARLAMPALNIKVRKARMLLSDANAAVRLTVVSVLADEAQSIIVFAGSIRNRHNVAPFWRP
jgi:hypothetical protein